MSSRSILSPSAPWRNNVRHERAHGRACSGRDARCAPCPRSRRIDRDYLTLEDVDVHDSADGHSKTTKDRYLMDAGKLGICTNRAAAKVRIAEIISISLLRDVPTF